MFQIFTDGASKGNPGPGGWGTIVYDTEKKHVVELGGREEDTTNNRMELAAVIGGLTYLASRDDSSTPVIIYSDSRYVVKGASEWIRGWKVRGWKTKAKEDVLNKDLWRKLDVLLPRFTIKWELLPGHSGIPGNERADEIASDFADGEEVDFFVGDRGDYDYDLSRLTPTHKKKKSSSGKSGKAYIYLSLVEGELKRHKTWDECKARVDGKKAKFRKALSADHEKEILKEWGHEESGNKN